MSNLKQLANKYISFKEPKLKKDFVLAENPDETNLEYSDPAASTKQHHVPVKYNQQISSNLYENIEYIRSRLNITLNSDVILREFDIAVEEMSLHAFIVFYDGMIDKKVLDDDILGPLMLFSSFNYEDRTPNITSYIKAHLLPHNQIKEVTEFNTLVQAVNYGACGIFIDTIENAFLADVKGFEHRTVERPITETVIKGPQEGFTETLRVNTSLIRKRLKDENLIAENIEVGERSKTLCSILYIKGIVNNSLVEEVKRRISSIKTDYLNDSGELEQFIEDNTFYPMPQSNSTERPDRSALALSDGRVVILVDGSPFALIVPTVFNDLIRSSEDYYLRFPYANLARIIRLVSILSSLLLPGLYIAITTFHQEMIPTSLLLAIDASREKVPFPTIVEIVFMETAFELIREAGIRIPGPLAPTIGIIGALILGQAAVAANIVSPVLIIIVAITGICSFAVPDYSMAFSIRIARFGYILLGAIAGFLGLSSGLFIHGLFLLNSKSFGVPMFAPYAPRTAKKGEDNIFTPPIWRKENRPDYYNPSDSKKQPKLVRGWAKKGSGDETNG